MPETRPATPDELRAQWNQTYAESPYRDLPWYSPRPYSWIVEAAEGGWWQRGTKLLDVGCGAGTNSLYLARRGFRVTGVDLAEGAIRAARARAARAGVTARFEVADALRLPFPDGEFGGALDVGCFHTLPIPLRRAYSKELARVLRPRRSYVLSWVAREARNPRGPPHRPSLEEVAEAFEEEFLFLRAEYRASSTGRATRGGLAVYCAQLGRRSFPRPPAR